MSNIVTQKVTVRKGAVPEMGTEWWTAKEWEDHAEYVAELKAKGEYLKEEEVTITMNKHSIFDSKEDKELNLGSARMIFLDFNKETNGK